MSAYRISFVPYFICSYVSLTLPLNCPVYHLFRVSSVCVSSAPSLICSASHLIPLLTSVLTSDLTSDLRPWPENLTFNPYLQPLSTALTFNLELTSGLTFYLWPTAVNLRSWPDLWPDLLLLTDGRWLALIWPLTWPLTWLLIWPLIWPLTFDPYLWPWPSTLTCKPDLRPWPATWAATLTCQPKLPYFRNV